MCEDIVCFLTEVGSTEPRGLPGKPGRGFTLPPMYQVGAAMLPGKPAFVGKRGSVGKGNGQEREAGVQEPQGARLPARLPVWPSHGLTAPPEPSLH